MLLLCSKQQLRLGMHLRGDALKSEEQLINAMAEKSFEKYGNLKNHPQFMEYLAQVSPLQLYAETNIGSRPAKRRGGRLSLNDLRANASSLAISL